jgi:hypothetical protein
VVCGLWFVVLGVVVIVHEVYPFGFNLLYFI